MGQVATVHIKAGVYTDETARGAEPYWHDCDRIRFRSGLPEQIGGWRKMIGGNGAPIALLGRARAIHDWSSLDNQSWVAVGTHLKLYLLNSGNVYDITPLRDQGTLTDPFQAVGGNKTLTVNHVAHGCEPGDFVHFTAQGNATLNFDGEHRVARVITVDQYEIDLEAAPASGGNGGGAVDFEYEIHVGTASKDKVYGYGVGGYGQGTYGTPRTESTLYQSLRTWSLDNWGEDLLASPVEGPVYWWDRSLGPNKRAVLIENAPATNRWIMVSPEDRHLICFGAHTTQSRDAMEIRWSDQENFNDFTPTVNNTSGDKRLDAGSQIVTAIDTRSEKLIFTDEALYSMQFIGGTYVFGFSPLGRSVRIIGPNAAAQVNGVVYFMGDGDFFVYDGVLRPLTCPVRNHVFQDIDTFQGAKVYATVNRLYSEIIWVYPSAVADDNDRYVIYNYREQVWYFGTIDRTAMHDQSSAYGLPYGVDPNGHVYTHEDGVNADDQPMGSFLESYDIDIAEGGQFMHVSRLIPDFLAIDGQVELTLLGREFPQDDFRIRSGPHPITAMTRQINVRARNRQIAIRVAAATLDAYWRMGAFSAEVRAHGRR
ncbi:hypothetical protein [Salinisphaera hydrothermalis]|uniref:Uncharacterized protein n=1 Tax=Salinisphaera hydrothermalis (strain C41B8) TaxID=1304275 RepID=A0A084INM1_SALHC|nr:hypothetical protein [Salinisphaera hydrothermalis]KEZ78305.1 hypothetical protein C41B8_05368 [Salinisphaera hydrothermalis C41B8]